jgi:hypothetical protein
LTGATGGETSDSEALIPLVLAVETLGDWEVTGVVSSLGSPLMVDVDDDRVKVWVKGARWVSFNFLVSFHDMVKAGEERIGGRESMKEEDKKGRE